MKQYINRLINALGLMTFMAMVSTGTILKWILPPGSGRVESLMRGGGRDKIIATLAGLSRHEWGEIHFYISIAFLIILAAHLYLHWNWIKVSAWGTAKSPQSAKRKLATAGITLFIIACLSLPWALQKKELSRTDLLEAHARTAQTP